MSFCQEKVDLVLLKAGPKGRRRRVDGPEKGQETGVAVASRLGLGALRGARSRTPATAASGHTVSCFVL